MTIQPTHNPLSELVPAHPNLTMTHSWAKYAHAHTRQDDEMLGPKWEHHNTQGCRKQSTMPKLLL